VCVPEMKVRIRTAIETITVDMLQTVWNELDYRVDFRTKYGKQPPSGNSIRRWYAQFQETGCVCVPEMKVRIRTAIETITVDMLQTVWNELDYRVDVCRITKGARIEHR